MSVMNRVRSGGARTLAIAYSYVDVYAMRLLRRVENLVNGFVATTLPPDDLVRVTSAIYDAHLLTARNRGLFPWEEDWFAERLPPTPAKLLITGAGGGREVETLADRGYTVDAIEPGSRGAAMCARRLGRRGDVRIGTNEDLARATLDDAPGPLSEIASRRYDAVLIGWGSLSHVLTPQERARTIRAASVLAPSGPVLASFWAVPKALHTGEPSRAFNAGKRLAEIMGGRESGAQHVYGRSGFIAVLDPREVEEAARAAKRRVVWEHSYGEYPHATLLPVS